MNIVNLLEKAVEAHASDIFIVAGLPISYRANGSIHHENEEKLIKKLEQDKINWNTIFKLYCRYL